LVHDELAEARRILTGLGLTEAQGQTLVSEVAIQAQWSEGLAAPEETPIRLANPLSSDMNVLRPSLLPGLLDALRHNLHHKNNDVALFEIGRVFAQKAGASKEQRRLAAALTGRRHATFWSGEDRQATFDVYDLKGVLEEFFEQFGVRGLSYAGRSASTGLFLESAVIQLGHQTIGEIGQLLPPLAKRYDLRDAVLLAELNLDLLLARRNTVKAFRLLPQFPTIQRDVAMVVPESTSHEAVLAVVKKAKLQHLESAQLFDVYRGQNVPAGHKSVAYSFTYRSSERTLTDAEVNTAHQKLIELLKQDLRAAIRE
jgi:phenylalanyl-tRNA synthetase beta chain